MKVVLCFKYRFVQAAAVVGHVFHLDLAVGYRCVEGILGGFVGAAVGNAARVYPEGVVTQFQEALAVSVAEDHPARSAFRNVEGKVFVPECVKPGKALYGPVACVVVLVCHQVGDAVCGKVNIPQPTPSQVRREEITIPF